jgi:hypothetical protein
MKSTVFDNLALPSCTLESLMRSCALTMTTLADSIAGGLRWSRRMVYWVVLPRLLQISTN